MVSIIIPVLNEEKSIEKLLKQLTDLKLDKEIIVVDGGSSDNTVCISKKYAKVIKSQKGRATQMNSGAKVSKGDILWFVHSDSNINKESLSYIKKAINQGYIGGGFSLYFSDNNSLFMKYIALTSNLRAKLLGLYFGDQGIFIRKDVFEKVGGFPKIEIMEDFQFSIDIKKYGKMKLLKIPIGTSARRFEKGGYLKTFILMQKMKILYMLGVKPSKLSKMYREAR
ncbi:transferase 2, rSAM/selenodomain-associated [Alkalithermobacter thermoalcaliphilus JW-YL-7 = DSM 7308]|uniref:4,4'-diaponeurosporenoate glycosyltransferase n=1 Tax=Alkalithermobacter thermoalcaliphilus JW-YL-7 = DSM 7308 TaxID=1121328 RepID=A0A150FQR3_CLOPD|nr:Transferase 2, rSAM/selenodomain-associated [[Clostridium] paradoxum JW-YL-7 = DSM 7308]SHK76952.1 transferase 2, rSAM/selenodomain-associated [[Clostridium] paradoxum JW-YL-7 = DSM 7308]